MKNKKTKKSSKFEPEWLDEDPDVNDSDKVDIYGDMTDIQRFQSKKIDPSPPKAKRETIAQFCGRLGMRLQNDVAQLDLHGMRLSEATTTVHRLINAIIDDGRIKRLRIITGKGNHSQGTGVLSKEIHPYVRSTFAKDIDDLDPSPADLLIRGHPARGYFDLKLI